jgi:TPR repeat protein
MMQYIEIKNTPQEVIQTDAEQGNIETQYQLGLMYLKGKGVRQSLVQATQWFRTAAECGHADAQYHLGMSYEKGEGLPQDMTQALKWYQKAANQGHVEAQEKIRRNNQERNQKVAALISQWLNEDDDYDERVWPEIERGLKKHTYAYPDDVDEEK